MLAAAAAEAAAAALLCWKNVGQKRTHVEADTRVGRSARGLLRLCLENRAAALLHLQVVFSFFPCFTMTFNRRVQKEIEHLAVTASVQIKSLGLNVHYIYNGKENKTQ